MKTAPRLDVELGEALHAYAERIPATPDIARLHTALDAAPAAVLPRRARRLMATSIAAGIAVLLGGTAAWALTNDQQGNKPTIDVTATDPATAPVPTTAAPVTTHAATPTAPAATAPAPTTVAPAAPAESAPPPVQGAAGTPHPAAPAGATSPTAAAKKSGGGVSQGQRHNPTPVATIAPPTTASNPPSNAVGFAASAAYGSCSEDPPYDIYSGTAEPGTRISITSLYGSGTATADEHGHWESKVVFAGSPLDEAFEVTVSSPQGSDTFSFTHTG